MAKLHKDVIIDDIETARYHLRSTAFTFYEWSILSCDYTLTENFMFKYAHKLNFHRLTIYQRLTEKFIDTYSDKLNWKILSRYQKLTPDIVLKYEELIDWPVFFKYNDVII